jgi:CheY-like chemotaxis protein
MSTLLIVDDDASAREIYVELLRPLCSHIDEAGDGEQALAMLREQRYSAVVMDLHMPTVDGLAVLDALDVGAHPNRGTPVFIVSGDASVRARIQVLRRKTVFFFNKPVDIDALLAQLEQAIKPKRVPVAPE